MITNLVDNYGLNDYEIEFVKSQVEELDFDFLRYADKVSVYINRVKEPDHNLDIDVFVKGSSNDDERGNGYFGWNTSKDIIHYEIEKESEWALSGL